jgi:hypothetical protein
MKTSPDQLVFILIETGILDIGSQKALAQKMKRAESTIGNWRTGKTAMPTPDFLMLFSWYRGDSLVASVFEETLKTLQ